MIRKIVLCAGVLGFSAGCGAADSADETEAASIQSELRSDMPGAVFTQSNEADGNRILAFERKPNGSLSAATAYPTGGLGSGAALGSQGALALSEDHHYLLAVDAGSNEVSSFAVDGEKLSLRDRVDSGGLRPISVTTRNGLVYVLNADAPASVTGFRLTHSGRLIPIAGSTRPLSAASVGPAQVELSPDGRALVVAEKMTNLLDTYDVRPTGQLMGPATHASAGMTPFGFEFTQSGYLVVSEAASGSLSSYVLGRHQGFAVITPALSDGQKAPCWVSITPDDRFAFTANAGSQSISSYAISRYGELTLKDAVAGATGAGSKPLDMAFAARGHSLYALDGGNHGVASFRVGPDATLTAMETTGALPPFAAGMVAY